MTRCEQQRKLNIILVLTFIVVAITGIVLLLHVRSSGLKQVHEWMGLAFLFASLLHAKFHWNAVISSLREHLKLTAAVMLALITLIALVSDGQERGEGTRSFNHQRNGAAHTSNEQSIIQDR